MASAWTSKDISDLGGKVAVVTGANSGIGFYTALELGRAGASVVVTARDADRGGEALGRLHAAAPRAAFHLELLDLARLQSVHAFADRVVSRHERLDLLVNNAGVMALPRRETTVDGFEMQFGTNHLGHFALTGRLLPALRQSASPRVVVVSSGVAAWGRVDLDDLQSDRRYGPMRTYSLSKLANLLFMLELGRRMPWLTAVASHPGWTSSGLQRHVSQWPTRIFGQPAPDGALPSLRAAVEKAPSGSYYAPKSWGHMHGAPIVIGLPRATRDAGLASALWTASEQLTGVRYANYR